MLIVAVLVIGGDDGSVLQLGHRGVPDVPVLRVDQRVLKRALTQSTTFKPVNGTPADPNAMTGLTVSPTSTLSTLST